MPDEYIETITYELSMHKTGEHKEGSIKITKMNCSTGETQIEEHDIGLGGYIVIENVMAKIITEQSENYKKLTEACGA